jgi:deazaflavin-dependent oxidoreductase (nitroreductase family)
MVSTTATAAPVRSNVPSMRVLHAVNPIVSAILRSPLHGMLSGSLLLLTFTGRKTGKAYTIPVNYTRDGEKLILFTDRAWRKNLRDGVPVTVRLQGHQRTGHAMQIEEPAVVVATVERLIARYGPKAAGRRVGLTLDPKTRPSHAQLAAAMEGHVLISLTLNP